MKTNKPTNQQTRTNFLLVLMLFFSFLGNTMYAQSTNGGILLSWDNSAGCQTYSNEVRGSKEVLIEDIINGQCITVCEKSQQSFILSGGIITQPNTTWSVVGGSIDYSSDNDCGITWGESGSGTLSFTTTSTTGVVTKTICFEIVKKPIALFELIPSTDPDQPFTGCSNQTLFFKNTSTANGGSGLNSYFWDFGDNTYSTALSPSHVYELDGTYLIKLTVTNSCGCSDTYKKELKLGKIGFDISCPSVVCEGQTEQYSLPINGAELCNNEYNWSVIGGVFTDLDNGSINVTWNHVDATGFGYVTFNPSQCNLSCVEPTTIRIPVIQNNGTIIGNSIMCLGKQERYKLPQWPSTDFHWEIVGNVNNNLATIILNDQRNEVIIEPHVFGVLQLKATYQNTLLHCGGTAIFNITVSNLLVIDGPDTVCKNTLSSFYTGENTGWTLTNELGNIVAGASNTTNFNYTFATTGTYTLTISGSTGCPSLPKTISVITVPPPTFTNPDLFVCPNAPYNYSVSGSNPSGLYQWSVTGGTFVGSNTGNNVTVIFDDSATHLLSVYSLPSEQVSCSSPTVTVQINLQPINAKISDGNSTVCANTSQNYSAVEMGVIPETAYTDGDTYTWSLSNPSLGSIISGQGTKDISILWNNATVNTQVTINLVIKKCTVTSPVITKTITINPLPTIVITPATTSVCSGSGATFTVSSAPGSTINPNATVSWSVNGVPLATPTGMTLTRSFTNNSTTPNVQNVSAIITNPNGCINTSSNTATASITVNPQPTATASIISAGGTNTFCSLTTPITAVLQAASFSGATIQWYRIAPLPDSQTPIAVNGVTVNSVANANLNCGTYGYGTYYFIANLNGCTATSNLIIISDFCGELPACDVAAVPGNSTTKGCTSVPVNTGCPTCGNINLIGSAPGSTGPSGYSWSVNGPVGFSNSGSLTGTMTNVPVGVYNTYFKAKYLCPSGQILNKFAHKQIVVAYLPDFNYSVQCNTVNNVTSYTLGVTDKTSFLTGVDPNSKVFQYTYKKSNATSYLLPLITVPNGSTPNLAILNTPGTYNIKLIVTGSYNGVAQQACEKIITITIAPVPNPTISVEPIPCHDTPVSFSINGNTALTDTYLWTFDNGATSALKSPQRVFTNSGAQQVSLRITNQFGCWRDLTPITVVIPPKCFNGDIVSNPTPATVCTGESVSLSYAPAVGDCAVTDYVWMEGNNTIDTPPNTPTIQVTSLGFYWVKVKSSNNCNYNVPSRITPIFKPAPTLIFPDIYNLCNNDIGTTSITTNASIISWSIDGIPYPNFNNSTNITYEGSSFSQNVDHTLTVTVTSANGCSKTESKTFTVIEAPNPPIITQTLISCNPYSVKLEALGTYDAIIWSNHGSGSTTIVSDGGPYSALVYKNGCNAYTVTNVPKSPENSIWTFPTGCYEACRNEEGTILGPNSYNQFTEWNWLLNNDAISSGSGIVTSLQPTQSGTYNLHLDNGFCKITSNDLNYNLTECSSCGIRARVEKIDPVRGSFCSFTLTLNIFNGTGANLPLTFVNPNNNVIITPNSFVTSPGNNSLVMTITPINGFLGGVVDLLINGIDPKDGSPCSTEFSLTVPSCNRITGKTKNDTDTKNNSNSLIIAPNPANGSTTITFNSNNSLPTIDLYTILGQHISSYKATTTKGEWQLDTTTIAAGMYIVVMKEDDTIIEQQKLIVK